jgi:hypothetical protein
MKKEIEEIYHGDVRELCDDLTQHEKREIVEEIIHRHDVDMDDIYSTLSTSQKEDMKREFIGEIDNEEYNVLFDVQEKPLNKALVGLFNKSHMLTKKEEQEIINISEQYKNF